MLQILGLALTAGALATTAALAQSLDGAWRGQMNCAKLSFTKGPQSVPITVSVSGSSANFSRQVYNEDRSAVVGGETGNGTVSTAGAISLNGAFRSGSGNSSFTATYAGTLKGGSGSLRGTQVWTYGGKTENRGCTISLKK
jgi:hypothetical protein